MLLTLYQTYNILSGRGYGFSCELHTYLEKPFTFSSMITNNLLRQLLSFQSVEPSLFQVPPACLPAFLVTPLVYVCPNGSPISCVAFAEWLLSEQDFDRLCYFKKQEIMSSFFAHSLMPNHRSGMTAGLCVFMLAFK